jgi:hypothetical protein
VKGLRVRAQFKNSGGKTGIVVAEDEYRVAVLWDGDDPEVPMIVRKGYVSVIYV